MIRYARDPFPPAADLDRLWRAAWGAGAGSYGAQVLPRSLAHVGAYDGALLVGFVNVAWDGGAHAFLLDTCVDPAFRHRGIGSELLRRAATAARERGAGWLHVDFEPHLAGFYADAGFRPTTAGLIRLADDPAGDGA